MEKCLCQQAKDSLDDTYAHPIMYHEGRDEVGSKQLRDIMEAEMLYWRLRYTCTCRKRARELDQENGEVEEEEGEEPQLKRVCTSDTEAEDGSGSEREALETDVEEEGEDPVDEPRREEDTCLEGSLEDLLPPKDQCGDCLRCSEARKNLRQVRQTLAAKEMFEQEKASCRKCSVRVPDERKCHCAENFEWKLRLATKTEKKLLGIHLLPDFFSFQSH